jgi:hypothetical protein
MGIISLVLHFVRTHKVFRQVRVVTNDALQGEQNAHAQSCDSKNVAKDGDVSVFAVESGNWLHHLLTFRAARKGLKFRLNVVENGCINPASPASKEDWARFRAAWSGAVAKANFAWATSASSFFLQFPEVDGWGLKPLGIELVHAPKSAKRANEIPRVAEMVLYTEGIESIRTKVRQPSGLSAAGRDGMNYVSQSFALRMLERLRDPDRRAVLEEGITSGRIQLLGTFRMVFPDGVIHMMPNGGLMKGHAIVRPDKFMGGYDIITVPENLKDELRATEPFVLATAEVKHVTYQATWDVQRMVMNPQILTHAHRQRDLTRLVDTIKESVNSGKLPEWLLLDASDEYEDEFAGVEEGFNEIDFVPYRWQAAGLDIRAAQNVVRLAMGAVTGRMGRFFEGGCKDGLAEGYARRMWLPKSNAFVAYFISHGSLTKVGNYRSRRDGSKAYMVRNIGLVLPDDRIEEILSLLGGADFDDSAEVNLIKVWSSSQEVTQKMRLAGVIGPHDPIGETAEDARYMACLLRSPNGIGEYAMVQMENILKAPWQFLDLDNVEVVDLATLPTPSTLLGVNGVLQGKLQYSRKSFSRQDATSQIMAQQFNPGIGGAANAVMAWVGSGGVDLPPSLKVGFEQLVDGVQQLSDPHIFNQVRFIGDCISGDAMGLLRAGNRVDEYLIPRFSGEDRLEAVDLSWEGPMSLFQEAYRQAIKEIHDAVAQKSLQMRHVVPLVARVRELPFSQGAKDTAKKFYQNYSAALGRVNRKFAYIRDLGPGIGKITATKAKHAEMRAVVDAAVAELLTYGEQAPKRAVAVWRYVLRPEGNHPYGHPDQLIFQPGNGKSVMDILIEGLKEYGIIDPQERFAELQQDQTWGDEEAEDEEFFNLLEEPDSWPPEDDYFFEE